MIYIVSSLLFILTNKRHNSIMFVLFALLLFTSIAAYLVGRQPQMEIETQFYSLYTAILLSVLFCAFKNYGDLTQMESPSYNKSRLALVEKVTSILGVIVLFLYAYILSQIFSMLLLGSLTVQEHKNEGGAAEVWATMVPHIFITLGNFVAPLGYFFLTLHFKYLIERNVKKSIKYLILSLCLILNGLIALSRSATVEYVLGYVTILFFILPLLSTKYKKVIISISGSFLAIIFIAMLIISNSRFSEYYTKQSMNEALLDETENPVLFSTLDYFSEWEENGAIIMQMHKPEQKSWGLFNCSGLAVHFQKMIKGSDTVIRQRENLYEDNWLKGQASYFHGVVARLIYDFGFIGTIIFILLYGKIIMRCSPRNGVLSYRTLLFLPVILPFCTVFWAGNTLSSLNLDLAIIYNLIIYKFCKFKKSI